MGLTTRNGQALKPLGLSACPDMEKACVPVAFAAGINYFFFYDLSYEPMLKGLKDLVVCHRDEMVIATGSESRDLDRLRTYRDDALRKLGIDALDIFYLEYISPQDDMEILLAPDGALNELEQWKAEGLIRCIGASTHNRPLAHRNGADRGADASLQYGSSGGGGAGFTRCPFRRYTDRGLYLHALGHSPRRPSGLGSRFIHPQCR